MKGSTDCHCEECGAIFSDVGGGDRLFCDKYNRFTDEQKCKLVRVECSSSARTANSPDGPASVSAL